MVMGRTGDGRGFRAVDANAGACDPLFGLFRLALATVGSFDGYGYRPEELPAFPHLHGPVRAAGGDLVAGGAERGGCHGRGVTPEHGQLRAALHVPDSGRLVRAAGDN